MPSGTVSFFHRKKFYGFCTPDNGGPDVFLGADELNRAGVDRLLVGQRIEFDVIAGRNGKSDQASNIVVEPATTGFGTVVRTFSDRGYAFVRPDNPNMTGDLFVPFAEITDGRGEDFVPGRTRVEFEVEKNTRPKSTAHFAVNVRIVEEAA